jgi:hypothetical protein
MTNSRSIPTVLAHAPAQPFAAAAAESSVQQKVLAIQVPLQEFDNWCWAAIVEGLERAIRGKRARSQCRIASDTLGEQCCPGRLNRARCDRARPMRFALGAFLRRAHDTPDARTFEFIREQIDQGFPVVAQIDWDNDGGEDHVVLITGYRRSSAGDNLVDDRIYVCDPSTGLRDEFPINEFANAFKARGTWVATFETTGRRRIPQE